jgi:hypothetical protein
MRKFALALAGAALFALPTSAFSQDVEIGPGGVQINPGYHHHHHEEGDCRELRAACLHKDELGEQGQGNCERYRRIADDPHAPSGVWARKGDCGHVNGKGFM